MDYDFYRSYIFTCNVKRNRTSPWIEDTANLIWSDKHPFPRSSCLNTAYPNWGPLKCCPPPPHSTPLHVTSERHRTSMMQNLWDVSSIGIYFGIHHYFIYNFNKQKYIGWQVQMVPGLELLTSCSTIMRGRGKNPLISPPISRAAKRLNGQLSVLERLMHTSYGLFYLH